MANFNATATPPPATKSRQPEQPETGTDAKQQKLILSGILVLVVGTFLLIGGIVVANVIGNVHQSLVRKAADEESKRNLEILMRPGEIPKWK